MDPKGFVCLWELLVMFGSQSKRTLINHDGAKAQRVWIMPVASVVAFVLAFLFVGEASADASNVKAMLYSEDNKDAAGYTSGKLLPSDGKKMQETQMKEILNGVHGDRIGTDCSKDDISISQTRTAWTGIPTYTVQITNNCASACSISNIHASCGWFSSARLINPRIFRRLKYNDCLVNNGAAMATGEVLSFQYFNTYPYPLAVSSSVVVCS